MLDFVIAAAEVANQDAGALDQFINAPITPLGVSCSARF
jgi:hypothetical protein